MKRDFLAITDFSAAEIKETFDLAFELKAKVKNRESHKLLDGQTLAMVFEKPSALSAGSSCINFFSNRYS